MRHLETALLTTAAQDAGADPALMRTGRTYTQRFHERKVDSLWARFTPEMRAVIPGPEQLAAFRAEVEGDLGSEAEVMIEARTWRAGALQTIQPRE
jgi:hypothetical protein